MSKTKDPIILLNKAHSKQFEARKFLRMALEAWLDSYNFPAEIKQGFDVNFLSGGENIVTYYGRGEFDEFNQLENLIGLSYDEVIERFNC